MHIIVNASIEWCLWWASFGFFQNLEDKSMNALGPNIYWSRWGAQLHRTCFGAVSFHAICAIQGHQHKKVYSPAWVNEILSLISKFSTNPLTPTKFQDTYFPCSLDWALQISNRGREQGYKTRSGASPLQSSSGQSDPWGAVERAAKPLLPLQGPNRGLETPPLEPLFVALEGSKRIELWRPNWTTVKTNLVSGSAAPATALLHVDARHTVKLGSSQKWRQHLQVAGSVLCSIW